MGVGGGIQTGDAMTKVKREDVQPSLHFTSHQIRPEATPLARKVMENELARHGRIQSDNSRIRYERKRRGFQQDIQNSGKDSGSRA